MRRLILLRHAKAENQAASGEDIDRALTARGLADAARMGQVLADAGLQPDLALVSSGVRARQTWEAAKAGVMEGLEQVRRRQFAEGTGREVIDRAYERAKKRHGL